MKIRTANHGLTIDIGQRQIVWYRPSYCSPGHWLWSTRTICGRTIYRAFGFDTYGWQS